MISNFVIAYPNESRNLKKLKKTNETNKIKIIRTFTTNSIDCEFIHVT